MPRRPRLRKASTHWLRHTFGTRIATTTRDVVLARDLLGHASVATTSIYLDGDEMARRDAVERLMEEGATAPRRSSVNSSSRPWLPGAAKVMTGSVL